jgi:hypothetical protein
MLLTKSLMRAALVVAIIGLVIAYWPIKDWNPPLWVRGRMFFIGYGVIIFAVFLLWVAVWTVP